MQLNKMTDKFKESVKKKSNNQLIDILINKDEYNPEIVTAAEIELKERRFKNTTEDIKDSLKKGIESINTATKQVVQSKTLRTTKKVFTKTIAVILIIIGLTLSVVSLLTILVNSGSEYIVGIIIFLFLGIISLIIGIKML